MGYLSRLLLAESPRVTTIKFPRGWILLPL